MFGPGGLAIVADRTWLRRVLVPIFIQNTDTEQFMNYFLGLANWPVGETMDLHLLPVARQAFAVDNCRSTRSSSSFSSRLEC